MRPAYCDDIVADVEKRMYDMLRGTPIAQDILKQFPNQPIEQLAETMAEGMRQGVCGDVARELSKDSTLPYYDELCKEAFKNALIRLLNEGK